MLTEGIIIIIIIPILCMDNYTQITKLVII